MSAPSVPPPSPPRQTKAVGECGSHVLRSCGGHEKSPGLAETSSALLVMVQPQLTSPSGLEPGPWTAGGAQGRLRASPVVVENMLRIQVPY